MAAKSPEFTRGKLTEEQGVQVRSIQKLIGIMVLIVEIAGCATKPTESEVQALISQSTAFTGQTVPGFFEEAVNVDLNDPELLALKELGYLDIRKVRKGNDTYVQLNEAGRKAATTWTQDPSRIDQMYNSPAPLGFGDKYDGHRHWRIPIGIPEITKVVDVKKVNENEATANFQFHWKPNDIGSKIRVAGNDPNKEHSQAWWNKDRTGTANLKQQKGKWSITKVDELDR